MQLIFEKDEESKITVSQSIDDEESTFSYVAMIKNLIKLKEMEPPEIIGNFTDAEKKSMNDMVEYINEVVASVETEDVEGGWEEGADEPF